MDSGLRFLKIKLLLLFSPAILLAQNDSMSDYLVLNTNDTIYGTVRYIKEEGFGSRDFFKKIRITDSKGTKKKFKRNKVSSFKTKDAVFESFWLNQHTEFSIKPALINTKYRIDSKGEQHFLRTKQKGVLSHYELEWFDQDSNILCSMALLKKENDNFFVRADQGLLGLKRKALINYFTGCSEITEALAEKQLKEVSQLVELYNNSCSN